MGRTKLTAAELKARGSKNYKKRALEEESERQAAIRADEARFVSSGDEPATDADIEREMRRVIMLLPGYDPHRDAEGYTFDWRLAWRAVSFFPTQLRFHGGVTAGAPFRLLDWQAAIVANLWGWLDKDGKRRYRTALVLVGKKNGKTAFTAGLVNLQLIEFPRPGAQIYSAATTMDQAGLVYRNVLGMIDQNPRIKGVLKTYGGLSGNHKRSVYRSDCRAAYQPLASDSASADGCEPLLAVVDELHRFHLPRHIEFCTVLENSAVSMDESLVIYITTADYARESVCNDTRKRAIRIRDGEIKEPTFLPAIYEIDPEDDWHDEANWYKANPSLGRFLKIERLRHLYRKALELPSERASFLRLHLNRITETAEALIEMDVWDSLVDSTPDPALRGLPVFAGLDLSRVSDLSAFVMLFYDGERFLARSRFWAPEDGVIEREVKDNFSYRRMAEEGFLTLMPGKTINYAAVEAEIAELCVEYGIREIGYDVQFATQMASDLEASGFEMFPIAQGFASMSPPTVELERLMNDAKIVHDGHPVLRWCAQNTMRLYEPRTDRVRPTKPDPSTKIDGMVALLMALARAMANSVHVGSVYMTRGPLSI